MLPRGLALEFPLSQLAFNVWWLGRGDRTGASNQLPPHLNFILSKHIVF
jgi:hypothetical protein